MIIETKPSPVDNHIQLWYNGEQIGEIREEFEDDIIELTAASENVYTELYELRERVELMRKELGTLRAFKKSITKLISEYDTDKTTLPTPPKKS